MLNSAQPWSGYWFRSGSRLSGASPFLMDVPDLLEVPEVPDGDPDVWGHLHATGFCLRFGLEGWTW